MSCGRMIGPYPCCSVVQGDCLELMRLLPDGCVDAVITDPPYGVRAEEWDAMLPAEFARFTMSWLSEARRIGGELVVFGTWESPLKMLCDLLYPRTRVLVWDKPIGSQYAGASERGLWFSHEVIVHCYQFSPKSLEVARMIREAREAAGMSRGGVDIAIRGKKTGLCFRWEEAACLPTPEQAESLTKLLGMNGEFSSALSAAYGERTDKAEGRDVLSYRTETNGIHPCEKPEGLMADLVTLSDAQTVIDPFGGSGTTGLAAKRLGRHYLLFEEKPDYCEIARKRIAAVEAQPTLFQPKPEQLSLEAK